VAISPPSDGIQFDYVSWSDNYNFTHSTTRGTLDNDVSLFDGLACNDESLTPQISDSDASSAIKYIVPEDKMVEA
jgi:hypothetical protein